jgi:tRNA pseudouridine38-40 synthase
VTARERIPEPVPDSGDGLVRVRLDLGYDGTDFSGWAKQPGLRTVEGAITNAIATVFRLTAPAQLTVAGRTDAGVHARGQVAHVDLPHRTWQEHEGSARRQLQGFLPNDIRLTEVAAAPTGFNARFSAVARRYSYCITDGPVGVDPLRRREVVWHRKRLDVAAMNSAAAMFLGEHDFASFCRRREGATTIRSLLEFTWHRDANDVLVASIIATAFCHNMVRALVGACVAVGEGRRELPWVLATMHAAQRSSDVTVMPPHGLTLEEIAYPADVDLADHAHRTRTVPTASNLTSS